MKLTPLQKININIKCSDFVLKCYNENLVAENNLSFDFLKELRKFAKQIIEENN